MRTLADIDLSMHDYIPRYYEDIPVATNIIDREADEIARLVADAYDVLAQMYIPTATWSVARWEKIFGIKTDETKPIAQRRSVIMSHLRGIGTVTAELIESVAEAYDNGDVDVTLDYAAYTVTITFVSNLGIPANLSDTQEALREIVPAHLAINFVFTYITYGQLQDSGKTFGDIEAAALTFEGLSKWDFM